MNLNHEFNHIPPVATKLHWAIERVLRPDGWELKSKLGGWNSFYLTHPTDKKEYHFRWWRNYGNRISVLDRYYLGTKLTDIDEKNLLRFVLSVKRGKSWK